MKKVFLLVAALTIVLSGAMAQKFTPKPSKKPTISGETVKGDKKGKAEQAMDEYSIKLPVPEYGLDIPLIEALKSRRTVRDLSDESIPEEVLSSLLWTAYGFNRPEEGKRVVPSAVNVQEFDIYVFTTKAVYQYYAKENMLKMVVKGDYRAEISNQPHFAVAPVSIVIVANYDRMGVFKDEETRDFYAAVDAGYVSQDIYLFCAANKLGTVACGGIDRKRLEKLLDITNGKALLAHPVGLIK